MIQAQHHLTEAAQKARYKEVRHRLMNPKLKPANVNQPEEPIIVKVYDIRGRPEWMKSEIWFDHHVRTYNMINDAAGKSPVRRFIATRAIELGFTFSQIMAKTRKKHIVLARHIIIWEVKTVIAQWMSYPDVGRLFDLDHTSILHAVRRIENLKDRGEVQTIERVQA